MNASEQPQPRPQSQSRPQSQQPESQPPDTCLTPTSFLAASAALTAIDEAVRTAQTEVSGEPPATEATGAAEAAGPQEALAALLLLRELRAQLAGWEPALIEAAREAGASWAELAHPLGVASRQAAERRYLRVRPGAAGTTGEQRVRATRDRRAADRSITAWARGNAADLRRLAGQIASLGDLPAASRPSLARLTQALGDDDAAALVRPLIDTHRHIAADHPDLAARVDTLTRHTDRLRGHGGGERSTS